MPSSSFSLQLMVKAEAIDVALDRSYSFDEYIGLVEKLHEEKRATSFPENEEYYEFSVLGLSRMKRIFKKFDPSETMTSLLSSLTQEQTWVLITESWCGDASQTVPVIAHLASLNEFIDLKIVLRDSNLDLMNQYLTNGAMSIPILVVFDKEMNELGVWGPRPKEAQERLLEYKSLPDPKPPYADLSLALQKWYNTDRGRSTEIELEKMLEPILNRWTIVNR